MGISVYPNLTLRVPGLDVHTLTQMHRHLRGTYAIC